ncbi:MAG: tyrosine--tRNA ligase [Candidatus Kapabacteria bacterium]|nr:tyrosine--tRNA ligase [Candidatus Kapabacteria bacterium]
MASDNIFEEFKWRDVVFDYTNEADKFLTENKTTAYIGFDPTAESLHVGSLLPIMCLARLQKFGHTPIALVGGGTGMIGDPSGKTAERQLLTLEKIEENILGIRNQLSRFLDFDAPNNKAQILNNATWLRPITLMDFLRDIGKHFTTNYMRSKESVKKREEDGISFTEFSYMLLQGYDFYYLNEKFNCSIQMGGSDQWGNIVAGLDLISKKTNNKAFGLTFPLVTSSTGVKFGKTESGTIWLDKNLTSPYKFYQFWLNTADDDVIKYLKYFSWLDQAAIAELEQETKINPDKRIAQKVLAEEITITVHGEDLFNRAKAASQILFGGDMNGLTAEEIKDIFSDVPSSKFSFDEYESKSIGICDFLAKNQIIPSKAESRRLIDSGGIYFNNEKMPLSNAQITRENTIEGKYIVVRKGKKSFFLVEIV